MWRVTLINTKTDQKVSYIFSRVSELDAHQMAMKGKDPKEWRVLRVDLVDRVLG